MGYLYHVAPLSQDFTKNAYEILILNLVSTGGYVAFFLPKGLFPHCVQGGLSLPPSEHTNDKQAKIVILDGSLREPFTRSELSILAKLDREIG